MNHNEDLKLIGLSIQVPTTWLQNACVPRRSVHLCTSWLAWSAGLYVAPSGLCLELEDAICARSYPHNHFREPSEIGRIWKVRNTVVCILHIKSDINISILHALLQTCVPANQFAIIYGKQRFLNDIRDLQHMHAFELFQLKIVKTSINHPTIQSSIYLHLIRCTAFHLRRYQYFQGSYNTPLEQTPGNPPSQLWKESLYSPVVKV